MKKILFLLFIIPSVLFSQVSSWRNSNTNSQTTSKSNVSQPTESNISSWRNTSPKEFNKPQPKPIQNVVIYDPYLNFNRWDNWGAPLFGWNRWSQFNYWNDWGYRQPARIYFFNDGRKDTIFGKKPIISFGLHHTTNSQMGVFFTVGSKSYFVFDFNSTYKRDKSTFFPYGTINLVDFPLINDLTKQSSFYFGLGKRIKRIGVHGMVGFAKEKILYRGVDDVGEITFPKSSSNFITFKLGVMKDFNNISIKLDYEPVIEYGQLGLGINF